MSLPDICIHAVISGDPVLCVWPHPVSLQDRSPSSALYDFCVVVSAYLRECFVFPVLTCFLSRVSLWRKACTWERIGLLEWYSETRTLLPWCRWVGRESPDVQHVEVMLKLLPSHRYLFCFSPSICIETYTGGGSILIDLLVGIQSYITPMRIDDQYKSVTFYFFNVLAWLENHGCCGHGTCVGELDATECQAWRWIYLAGTFVPHSLGDFLSCLIGVIGLDVWLNPDMIACAV